MLQLFPSFLDVSRSFAGRCGTNAGSGRVRQTPGSLASPYLGGVLCAERLLFLFIDDPWLEEPLRHRGGNERRQNDVGHELGVLLLAVERRSPRRGSLPTGRGRWIAFNPEYLADAIRFCGAERGRMWVRDGLKPVLFEGPDRRYALMPIRLP
jgi:hypothetical protein